jgi:putative oxidoreductase
MNRLRLLTDAPPRALADGMLLAVRLTLGVIFIAHGWQAHSMGLSEVVEMQRSVGVPLPEVGGPLTVYGELIGGPLLIAGLLTRPLALALSGIMLGAWAFVHAEFGLYVEDGGYELVLALAVLTAALAVAGPGRFSADALLTRAGAAAPVREAVR